MPLAFYVGCTGPNFGLIVATAIVVLSGAFVDRSTRPSS